MTTKFLVVDADGEFRIEDSAANGAIRGSMRRIAVAQAVLKVTVDEHFNLIVEPIKLRGQFFLEGDR